jgi:glyoxylase-like metal-dependent hydrolase (beta-lactamase superfamily II)
VINTHWHWDHVWGNAVFAAAEIWGHEACRRHMIEHGEADRAAVLDWLPEEHHDSVREVIITPPTHSFSDHAEFDLAGRAVSARYVGLAHTDSDVVVAVPAAGVVFAGDIIEEGAPPSFDVSYPLDWPAALDRLLALEWEIAVPGHGDVVDRGFVARQRDQIAELGGIARDAFSAGAPAEQIDLSGAPFGEQAARVAVERAFRQLAGDLAGG